MSYDFDGEGADIRRLGERIDRLEQEVIGLPFRIEDNNGVFSESLGVRMRSRPAPRGGAVSMDELTDVFMDTLNNNQVLAFDSTDNKWKNSDLSKLAESITADDIKEYFDGLSKNQWKDFTNFTGTVGDMVGDATAPLDDAIKNVTKTLDGVTDLGAWLEEQTKNIEKSLGDSYADAIKLVDEIGKDAGAWLEEQTRHIEKSLGSTYSDVTKLADEIGKDAGAWLEEQGTQIEKALGDSYSDALKLTDEIGANAGLWLEEQAGHIEKALGNTWLTMSDVAEAFGSGATTWLEEQGSHIEKALGDSWEQMDDVIKQFNFDATNSITGISDSMAKLIDEVADAINESGQQAYDYLEDLLQNGIGSLTGVSDEVYEFVFGKPDSNNTNNSTGDVDLKTFDLWNVDRVFFNSNDSVDTSSNHAHITSKSKIGPASLVYYVPKKRSHAFMKGKSIIMQLTESGIMCNDRVYAGKKISVGKDSGLSNGDIAMNSGKDIIVHTGGNDVNLSNIGRGGYSFDSISEDLIPDENDERDIGSRNKKWNNCYLDVVKTNALEAEKRRGDINVNSDLDFGGSNTIDFGTSASAPSSRADPVGAIQIKVNGVTKLIKIYDP